MHFFFENQPSFYSCCCLIGGDIVWNNGSALVLVKYCCSHSWKISSFAGSNSFWGSPFIYLCFRTPSRPRLVLSPSLVSTARPFLLGDSFWKRGNEQLGNVKWSALAITFVTPRNAGNVSSITSPHIIRLFFFPEERKLCDICYAVQVKF